MKQEATFRAATLAPVALFIDGENLSPEVAADVVAVADSLGQRGIRRVYGDAARMIGWRRQGTLQVVDSAQGKNAADMLLAIEAMETALFRGVRIIAIASRDRDFSHLARKLAEHGVHVVGIGPADPDCAFRKACCDYRVIGASLGASPAAVASPPDPDKLRQWVATAIGQASDQSLNISDLAKLMKDRHGVTKARLPTANWKSYLASEERFDVDSTQIVRLRKKKPPQSEGS